MRSTYSRIDRTALDRKLTQGELGKLVGVQKAQISKLENSLTRVSFKRCSTLVQHYLYRYKVGIRSL